MKAPKATNPHSKNLVRPKDVASRFSIAKPTVYYWIKQGFLPPMLSIGGRSKALPEHELDAIYEARLAGYTDQEARDLVQIIISQRVTPPLPLCRHTLKKLHEFDNPTPTALSCTPIENN